MEGRKDLVGLQRLETDFPSNSIFINLALCPDVSSFKPLNQFGATKETFLDVHQGLCKG